MTDDDALTTLIRVIGRGEAAVAIAMIDDAPSLATASLGRSTVEFFDDDCFTQVYRGDTALHAAAFAYEPGLVRHLLSLGADVRARNRRGAEPLHAAITGGPSSTHWDPARQTSTMVALLEGGADPNAPASGGVTPLHRAVRNRCSNAVRVLLDNGADPLRRNDSGSTALTLAQLTTGRGGTGSPAAKAEQAAILAMLSE